METDWDVESTCESIQKRLDKCIHLSGTASLELNLDFSESIPPQDLTASQIRKEVSRYTHSDGQDTLEKWIHGLDVDFLSDSQVMPACQPPHLFELLWNLIGDDGNIMSRWVSLCLDLPQDPELRRLVVRGVVPNFDTFEFRVPFLDELYLSRDYMTDACIYPKLHAHDGVGLMGAAFSPGSNSGKIKVY